MLNPRAVVVVAFAGMLAACGSGESSNVDTQPDTANIANIESMKSTFPAQFHVSYVGPTGVDPRLFESQKMPPGGKFEPADCAKWVTEQVLPSGLKGNMAATTAEGEGNRFIAMAIETSEPVAFNDPGQACQKVGFAAGSARGMIEVVEAPQIDGVRTIATHRVVQTVVEGKRRTGELYNFRASFGSYMVIVTANPLVLPDKPVARVDTQRARELLTASVAAVRR